MLMVIADPGAPFLKALSRLPPDVEAFVSDDAAGLQARAPDADAVLYASLDAGLLAKVLPRANRLRWIHCLWTGVDGVLIPEMIAHSAQFTNGRGVFREPLADWVIAIGSAAAARARTFGMTIAAARLRPNAVQSRLFG